MKSFDEIDKNSNNYNTLLEQTIIDNLIEFYNGMFEFVEYDSFANEMAMIKLKYRLDTFSNVLKSLGSAALFSIFVDNFLDMDLDSLGYFITISSGTILGTSLFQPQTKKGYRSDCDGIDNKRILDYDKFTLEAEEKLHVFLSNLIEYARFNKLSSFSSEECLKTIFNNNFFYIQGRKIELDVDSNFCYDIIFEELKKMFDITYIDRIINKCIVRSKSRKR